MFKKVEAIIRQNKLKKALDALADIDYPGVTVQEVQGHGLQKGVREHYRDQTARSLLTKVMVTVVVEDREVKKVCDAIIGVVQTGEFGDGKIFINPVDDVIRIRTGEKGKKAIR